MAERALRWYGWGYADTSYSLEHRPGAWPYLQERLGLPDDEHTPPVDPATITLRPSRAPEVALAALRLALGEDGVSTADEVRLAHSFGKSYLDAVALRRGQVPNPTDAVVFPASEEAVQQALALAATHGRAVASD